MGSKEFTLHCIHYFPADEENPGTTTGSQRDGGERVSGTAHVLTGSYMYILHSQMVNNILFVAAAIVALYSILAGWQVH